MSAAPDAKQQRAGKTNSYDGDRDNMQRLHRQ
jgi:hypothetical protein